MVIIITEGDFFRIEAVTQTGVNPLNTLNGKLKTWASLDVTAATTRVRDYWPDISLYLPVKGSAPSSSSRSTNRLSPLNPALAEDLR